MGKYIPGQPEIVAQNMPGAGSVIATNHVFGVAKPDGLTIGMPLNSVYVDQLVGRKEVQFDLRKFQWIGSPALESVIFYIRADTPYRTIADVIKAKEPPKCGSTGAGTSGSYMPKLLEETLGTKFSIVAGYQGGGEIDLAVERGELHCRAFTIQAYHSREPYHSWRKKNFARILMQTGQSRDPRLADVPTLRELMDEYKTPDADRKLVPMVLAATDFGRPIVAPPGIPTERLKILREAFLRTMKDPELLAEAKRKNFDITPSTGEELESLAKLVMSQPPEIISRVNVLMEQ
jgi:tripartite-type tricarboxylate transporter receptor subunit TctC